MLLNIEYIGNDKLIKTKTKMPLTNITYVYDT